MSNKPELSSAAKRRADAARDALNAIKREANERSEVAMATIKQVAKRGCGVFKAPSLMDPQFRSDKGNVDLTAYHDAKALWEEKMDDLVQAIFAYGKANKVFFEFNKNSWRTDGELRISVPKKVRKAS